MLRRSPLPSAGRARSAHSTCPFGRVAGRGGAAPGTGTPAATGTLLLHSPYASLRCFGASGAAARCLATGGAHVATLLLRTLPSPALQPGSLRFAGACAESAPMQRSACTVLGCAAWCAPAGNLPSPMGDRPGGPGSESYAATPLRRTACCCCPVCTLGDSAAATATDACGAAHACTGLCGAEDTLHGAAAGSGARLSSAVSTTPADCTRGAQAVGASLRIICSSADRSPAPAPAIASCSQAANSALRLVSVPHACARCTGGVGGCICGT